MRDDELNRLIMSSGANAAWPASADAATILTHAAATARAALQAKAVTEACKAGAILVQSDGGNDDAPNAQGQVKQGEKDDDRVKSNQQRNIYCRTRLIHPVACRAIPAPTVGLRLAHFDRR